MDKLLRDRIESHIDHQGDCWVWTGSLHSTGKTPVVQYQRKIVFVRRALYEDANHSVGKRLLRNVCGNPRCVNPAHTEIIVPTTNAERCRRRAASIRGEVHRAVPRRKIDRVRELARRCGFKLVRVSAHSWAVTRQGHIEDVA